MAEQFGQNDLPKRAPQSDGPPVSTEGHFGSADNSRRASKSYPTEDYVGAFSGGFNEGLVGMLGLPVDLVSAGLGLVGLDSETPIGGSKSLRSVTPDAFFPEAPDNVVGRGLNRVGQEVGAAVVPMGGTLKAAGNVARMGKEAQKPLAKVVLNTLKSVGKSPGKATAAEAASAVGSGIGAAVAGEVAPGNVFAEMAGQIIGGLGPSAAVNGPTGLAARAGAKAYRRFSPTGQEKAGADAAERIVGEELSPSSRQSLEESEALRSRAPGFNPSLGEATGSPSLLAQQRDLEKRVSGGDLEALAARRAGSEAGIEGFRQNQAPAGQSSPDVVFGQAGNELYLVRGNIDAERSAVRRDREVLAGEVPKGNLAEEGATLRNSVNRAKAEAKERMGALAVELGIRDLDVSAPFERARDKMIADVERITNTGGGPKQYQSSPAAVPNTLKRMKAKKGSWTLGEIVKLREDIGAEIRATRPKEGQGAEGARERIRALVSMRRSIDGFLDELAETPPLGGDPRARTFADNYRTFRDAYFKDYVEVFERPLTKDINRLDAGSFYRTEDERVAGSFFKVEKQGGVSAAREFKRMVQGDPEALAAYEATVLDSLYQATVKDGLIDQKAFQNWQKRYGNVVDEFPELAAKVKDIGKANAALLGREAELATRAAVLERLRLTKLLDGYKGGVVTGEEALKKALGSQRDMAELTAYIRRDDAAMAALKRSVWDLVTEGSAQDIAKAVERYKPALGKLFTKQHLADIEAVMKMKTMMERTPAPQGAAVEARPLKKVEELIGQGVPQLSSRAFAFQSGRMQKGYLVTDTLARGLRGREQQALEKAMVGALYDPRVASRMRRSYEMKAADIKNRPTYSERLALWVMRHGGPLAIRVIAGQTNQADQVPTGIDINQGNAIRPNNGSVQ
ncbi:MAG: hypothetical protein RIC87_12580 [Kiloniellales bacterium]